MTATSSESASKHGSRQWANNLFIRAVFLSINFFLIITAYYQLKPASRSLFIEYLGAEKLPYVWIATAVILTLILSVYHLVVKNYSRFHIVIGSCTLFIVILLLFRIMMSEPDAILAASLHIFADIFSVVLVEQFWSLANSLYTSKEGKRWYGIVGAGGVAGGMVGSGIASLTISHTPLETPDLLLVAAGIISLLVLLTIAMRRLGLYGEQDSSHDKQKPQGSWRVLTNSRYLTLIAIVALLGQLAATIVDYQFMNSVQDAFQERDPRTVFIANFFFILSAISLLINLVISPLIYHYLGVVAGLLAQPLMLFTTSALFMSNGGLMFGAAMKLSDRALAYSISRTSKELLYVPLSPVLIYQAKAWIDMLGYRVFKVLGSVLILALTDWGFLSLSVPELSWLTLSICLAWLVGAALLHIGYRWRAASEL
ncbi:MAG: Npt1/Npt2 family nucleotide transporter [Gammaproteobacteria bacterium]|nr:Npt1/Npt2 family nucleotide transporter [Gammaproteobacteria bacterium]